MYAHIPTDADISEEITSRSMIVCFDEDDPSAQSVYGPTSTLMLLKGMHPLPPPAAVDEVSRERPHKRLRYEHPESELDSSLADKIYEAGETYDTRDLDFRGTLAKKHLDSFFDTVHGIYPIFDENSFRGSYPPFEHDSFRMAQDVESRRLQCLMYSVLSLGALYMNTTEDAKWAAKYFGEAEKLVSSLFGKTSVQAVQALAYNYLGVAIRLAYSAGINDMRAPRPNTLRNECALRTWWSLYSLESDICLEYGRPLCIRETDAKAPYPKEDIVRVKSTHCVVPG
ncbi:hypothetical protein N7454_002570 [Penicillium verhagenii]|nr:hypothetical protein N7454_002570 [Penicillium verhagenii]